MVSLKRLSQRRFDALVGYSRSAWLPFVSTEIAWYATADERVLGLLVQDSTDGDYGAAVLGRDKFRRYRAISLVPYADKRTVARHRLWLKMEADAALADTEYWQDDEEGAPLDFFAPIMPRKLLHPYFRRLQEDPCFGPAKELLRVMMHHFRDPDHNFIEQFQTVGFDARLWELYLFATFTELGFAIDRSHSAPFSL